MTGLYESEDWFHVLMVTGMIGGGAAWLAGRAIAQTWRPAWHAILYMILLGGAVRFVHFALFYGTLLSLPSYLADAGFLTAVSLVAYRMTRARQMATQYPWLYRRTGPFTWREHAGAGEKSTI